MDFLILDKYLLQGGGKETFHPAVQEKFRISFPREVEKGPDRCPSPSAGQGLQHVSTAFFLRSIIFIVMLVHFKA